MATRTNRVAANTADEGQQQRARASARSGVATPWGPAAVLEEAAMQQRVGDRRFAVVVQLLESANGEQLVRFAYTTDGSARRGPVTMRARDLERLRAALERAPVLREVLTHALKS
jgi:hypothetical protein